MTQRKYGSDADRQRAYRERQAEARRREAEELHRLRQGGGKDDGLTVGGKRVPVPVRLAKVLGMLGSDHDGEVLSAARKAMAILKEANLTWYDVLAVKKETKKK